MTRTQTTPAIPVSGLTGRRIVLLWVPLAMTWFMMALEGPFLTALVARLDDAKFNLAAFGVAFTFALIAEAPIMMIMSAATALVRDRDAYLKLRNFTFALNVAVTLFLGILLFPPLFHLVAEGAIGLPAHIAAITHRTAALMLLWPAAIGYRRLYQGILIRRNQTRRVAYGTVIRLAFMSVAGLLLYRYAAMPGACVAAAALSVGVVAEAAASRWMARMAVAELLRGGKLPGISGTAGQAGQDALRYRAIAIFYFPLALTSLLTLAVSPMVTFFLGRSRMAIESLAVMPVVTALVFLLRCLGVSFQEVCVALLGDRFEGRAQLARFGWTLGLCASGVLALTAFTPLSGLWFTYVSGLKPELADFAREPLRLLILIPALEVLLSYQRSLLIGARRTNRITWATGLEVVTLLLVLFVLLKVFDWPGAVGAAGALFGGRIVANVYLGRVLKAVFRDGRPLQAESSPGRGAGQP